jgi:hypothetical protein
MTPWILIVACVLIMAFIWFSLRYAYEVDNAVSEILSMRAKGAGNNRIGAYIFDKYGKHVHDDAYKRIERIDAEADRET